VTRPDTVLRARSVLRRWGLTPGAAYAVGAIRHPDRAAIIDERGALTFAEVQLRTDALAHALGGLGVERCQTVAVMCRNHRGFIEASVACSKLAADVLCLDPAAGPDALREAVRREDPRVLIYDEEFSEIVHPLGRGRTRVIGWCEDQHAPRHRQLEELIADAGRVRVRPPAGRGHSIVTLTGQGACVAQARRLPSSLMLPGAVRSQMPLRAQETTMIAAPMCEPWGFLHLMLGLRLASTLVLHREFDALETLAAVDRHGVSALAVLPEMLARIMELPEATLAWYSTALRVIAVKGPALSDAVALPAMARFGDVLYNVGGTTMVRLGEAWNPAAAPRVAGAA
jgi:fatty-acyl-CoA synthase